MASRDPLAGYSPDWRKRQQEPPALPTPGSGDDPLAGYSPDWRGERATATPVVPPAAPSAPERPSLLGRIFGGDRTDEVRALQREMMQAAEGRIGGPSGSAPRTPQTPSPGVTPAGGRFRAFVDALGRQSETLGRQVVEQSSKREQDASRGLGQGASAYPIALGEGLQMLANRGLPRSPQAEEKEAHQAYLRELRGQPAETPKAGRGPIAEALHSLGGRISDFGAQVGERSAGQDLFEIVGDTPVETINNAIDFALESAQQGAVSSALPLGLGVGGARVGAAIGGAGGPAGRAAGAAIGAGVGAFAGSLGLNAGTLRRDLRETAQEMGVELTDEQLDAWTTLGGSAMAVLDSAIPAHVAQRLAGAAGGSRTLNRLLARKIITQQLPKVARSLPARVAGEGLKAGLGESVTEALQDYAQQITTGLATGKPIHTREHGKDLIRAAAAGFFGGLPMGAAGGVRADRGRLESIGKGEDGRDYFQHPETGDVYARRGRRGTLEPVGFTSPLEVVPAPESPISAELVGRQAEPTQSEPAIAPTPEDISNERAWWYIGRIQSSTDPEERAFIVAQAEADPYLSDAEKNSVVNEWRAAESGASQPSSEPAPVADRPAQTPAEAVPDGDDEVVAAAIRTPDGRVFTGDSRIEALIRAVEAGYSWDDVLRAVAESPDGALFQTRSGRIVSREEAGELPPRFMGAEDGVLPGHGEIRRVRTSDLTRAPELMQYKTVGIGEGGVTRELKHVRKWDPIKAGVIHVWRDPQSGTTYVVNGHHRHELAERLGVPGINVQYINAPDAESARLVGALANIAEGRGTAVDAAKVFRTLSEQGDDVAAFLEEEGVSLKGAVARDGLALSNLAPGLFTRVSTGEIPQNIGVAIGATGLNEAQQYEVWKLANAGSRLMSADQVEEAARYVKAAGTENVQQETLFGTETADVSLALPKIQLSAWVREQLAKEKRLFSFVGRGERARAIEAEGAGTIDTERSQQIAEQAAQAEEVFKRLSIYAGPVSDALNEAARRVVAGEKIADVRKDLYAAVREAVVAELEARQSGAPGVRADPQVGDAATGTAESAQAVDTATGDLFGEAPAPTPIDTETGNLFGAPEPESAPTPSGRALFTPVELAEFDRLGIDVSQVPAKYKDEALQQLAFRQQKEAELAAPDYDERVRAEYRRQEDARNEDSVRSMEPSSEGRPVDGQPIMPGDRFRTVSGNVTTPYPRGKDVSGLRRDRWLAENALAEAERRGDEFNARQFRSMVEGLAPSRKAERTELSPSDRDSLNSYLWEEQPPVVPSILRPLSAESAPSATPEPAPEIPDRVRRTVERALNELRSVQQSIESGREADRRFGPDGRYEADAYQNTSERREQYERVIEEFRTRARAMGIDPEAVLAEMGGVPDLSISDSAQEWLQVRRERAAGTESAPAPAAAPAPEVAAAPDPTPEAAPEPGKIVYSKPATYQGRREIRVTREGDNPIYGPRLYIVQHEKGGKTYYIEQRTTSGGRGATTKVRLSDPLPLREAKKLAAELLPQEELNPFERGATEARQNTEPATDTPAEAESTPEPATELPFGRVGVDDETSFYGTPVEVYEPMTDSWTPGTVTRVLNGGTLIEVATDPNDPQRTFRYSAENVRRVDDAAPTAPETATADTETAPTPERSTLPIEVSPDDIPYDLAFEAYRNISHTPERRVEQVRQEYVNHIQALYDSLAPLATTDEARATLAAELEKYRDTYLKHTREVLQARSRTVSAMVTGPARFPTRRNEKALETEMRRVQKMTEWSKKAQERIRRKLQPERGPISSDDPNAPKVIRQKIAEKEKLQETMVAANRIVRMKSIGQEAKIERLKELGLSEKVARKLFEPDFANRLGFPDYQLNNNRAEIKRLKERLAEIETRRSEATTEVAFEGGTVVDNVEDNRLQIFFDSKPDADLRKKLKEAGFRWAPSVEAWQRQRGPNANAALQRVLGVRVEGQAEVRERRPQYGDERIAAAAIRTTDGAVYTGPSHGDVWWENRDAIRQTENWTDYEEGFVTSTGRFVTRDEAAEIATRARQTRIVRPMAQGDRPGSHSIDYIDGELPARPVVRERGAQYGAAYPAHRIPSRTPVSSEARGIIVREAAPAYGTEAVVERGKDWYHGTSEEFATFDDEFRGSGAGGAGTDEGFWFTDEEDAATLYARYTSGARGGGRVIKVRLNIRNPLIVDLEEVVRNEIQMFADEVPDLVSEDANYVDQYRFVFPSGDALGNEIFAAVRTARARGHDSVIFRNIIDNPIGTDWDTRFANYPQTHIVVFDSELIQLDGEPAAGVVREPTATYGARSITDSPAFRRWFGDSKVVDERGRPLVVYHGSPVSDITEFRGGQTAYGIFFSDSLQSAAYYNPKADLRSPSENDVYAVYLKAANPADLRNAHVLKSILSEAGRLDEADEIAEYIERGELYNYDGRGRIQDEIVRTAEYMGHDAVILPDTTSGELANSYIVFRPEQIKSATGNVGTFDPSDPSIVREGAANYNLFGDEEPAPAQPKQGDLFGAPEPSRRPQGLTEAEQEARQIVSVLAGKVGRGTATEAQLERYREAMALLERDQKLKPEDIAGRSEQETLPLDPRVGDLFDMLREGESLSPEQKKLATRLIREQFVLDFGSIEAARRAAAQTLREAGDLAVASHPALEMTEARKRLVAEARQTAFVSLAAKGTQIEVDADGKLVPESVFRLLRPYRSPLAEYMHAIVVAPDAEGNMRVVHHRAITSGAIDMVTVSMSDFAEAAAIAKRLGGQVLIAHNHPSGDPTPSPEDRDVTMRVVETIQAAGATYGGHYVINHETATLIGHDGQYLTVEPLRVPRESEALDWTDLYGEKVTGPASVVSYLSKLPVDDKRLDVVLLNTQHQVIAMDLRPLASLADIAEWLPSLMRETAATTVILGTGSRRAYNEAVAAANAHQWFPLLDIVDVGSGTSAVNRRALEPRFGTAPASMPIFERGPDYGGRDGDSPNLQRQAGTPTEATDPDRPDATRVPGAAEGAIPLPGSIAGEPGRGEPARQVGSRTSTPATRPGFLDLGAITSTAGRALRRNFTSAGLLPSEIFERKIARDGWISSQLRELAYTLRDFRAAAKEVYGGEHRIGEAELERLNDALAGDIPGEAGAVEAESARLRQLDEEAKAAATLALEAERTTTEDSSPRDLQRAERLHRAANEAARALRKAREEIRETRRERSERAISSLPEAMQPVVRQMRDQIDALSRRMIDSGAVEGELVATVEANMGTYLTRSYRVFDDPKWADKVPEDVKNRAKALLRSEFPDKSEAQIDGIINELLFKLDDGPLALVKGSKLGSKDLTTLIRRKNISPEIRALWGEYKDPRVNLARSVTKMAHLIANHEFLTDVREQHTGEILMGQAEARPDAFFYPEPITRNGISYHVEIAPEGSEVMAPLNGLYTTPEIAQAFRDVFDVEQVPDWLRLYMKLNGAVKYSKTVGSAMTHVRNLVGNVGFAVANGHWRAGAARNAFKTVMADLGARNDREWRDYYRKLQELGVVDESAHAGELRDAIKDASRRGLDEFAESAIERGAKKTLDTATALYRAEDDVWKVFAFENEVERYSKALPDVPRAEIERRAARIVRNTYPTYSLVPRGIKWVRRFPVVGTFVSFPTEVVRTLCNTIELTTEELRDPRLRGIGAERLAGMTMAATGTLAAVIASRFLAGILKDEEDDLREFLPPWSENSDLIHLGRDEDGKYRFIDISYTDPYSYLRKPIMALLRGEDWNEALVVGIAEFFDPYLSEDILAEKLLDISRNQKKGGGRVYNPQDDAVSQNLAKIAHLWDALEPGTITSVRRIWMGATGKQTVHGRSYNLGQEISAVVSGFRISELDVPQSLSFRIREVSRGLNDARGVLISVASRRGTVTDAELRRAYETTETSRRRLFRDAYNYAQAAVRLGMTEQEARRVLASAGFSAAEANLVMSGRYRPYRPGDNFLSGVTASERAVKGSGAEQREAMQEFARRRRLIQRLAAEHARRERERSRETVAN